MFDSFCIEKILAGEKTVTRRLLKVGGRRPAIPGTIHRLKVDRTPKVYGYILINSCTPEILGDIDDEEAKKEGFNNVQEYVEYFMDVNNLDIVTCHEPVWRVRFTLLPEEVYHE